MKKTLFTLITVIAISLMCFAACGAPDEDSPTAAADAFFAGIKAGDDDAVNAVYAPGDFTVNGTLETLQEGSSLLQEHNELIDLMQSKVLEFEYKLSNEKIDGDDATVDVKFTTYPFGSAVNDFVTDFLPEAISMSMNSSSRTEMAELAESMLTEKMEALDEKRYEKKVTLSLVKEDGAWKVAALEEDSKVYNAMTGNLVQALEDLSDMYESYSGGF